MPDSQKPATEKEDFQIRKSEVFSMALVTKHNAVASVCI